MHLKTRLWSFVTPWTITMIAIITAAIAGSALYLVPAEAALNPTQLQTLRTELDTDPQTLGYAGKTNYQIALLLNEVGLSGETIDREFVMASELQGAVVGSEAILLLSPQRDLWAAFMSIAIADGTIPLDNNNLRGQVLEVWGAGTTTRSNLAALQTRSASRAEVLFGDGVVVTDNDVEEAFLLP